MWALERGKVIVRRSSHNDVLAIKDRLRKTDVEEIWASTHMKPEEALIHSRSVSSCCQTVLYKCSPVAIFGTARIPDRPQVGGVWFLATDDLRVMWLSFLRMSRECVSRMLDEYPLLFNWVDARNVESIAWLKWCGAKIEKPKPFGPDKMPFHFFTIKRSDLCVQR